MAKKNRPPKANIPSSATTTKILELLKSQEARIARLEEDEDLRAEKAAQLRRKT